MQHFNNLTGILPGGESHVAEDTAAPHGTPGLELATAAATHASISSTQSIGRESATIKNTKGVVPQAQHDEPSHHNAKPQDEKMGSHLSLEADRHSIGASSTGSTTSQDEDLQSKLEHVQAMMKKARASASHHQELAAQTRKKLKSKNELINSQGELIVRLKQDIEIVRHNQKVETHGQRAALEEKEQVISSMQEKLNRIIAENCSLKADLEDCKERIFTLQPFEGKPDTEIASLYEELCQTVTALGASLFDRIEDNGVSANGTVAITASSVLQPDWTPGYNNETLAIVEANPLADEVLVSSIMLRYLFRKVLFGGGFCFGVDDDSQGFVLGTMDGLHQLEPAKDPQTIEIWRIDTYRAFSAMKNVQKEQAVRKEEFMNMLLRCIDAAAPGTTDQACQERCREAVENSVRLAHEMQLNMATYHGTSFTDSGPGSRLLYGREMQEHKFIDAKTGQMLRRSAIKEHAEDTIIGEKIRNVFPALVRKSPKKGRELILVKETILVHIYDEFLQKKQKRTEAGASLLED